MDNSDSFQIILDDSRECFKVKICLDLARMGCQNHSFNMIHIRFRI